MKVPAIFADDSFGTLYGRRRRDLARLFRGLLKQIRRGTPIKTTVELADLFDVSPMTMYRWKRNGIPDNGLIPLIVFANTILEFYRQRLQPALTAVESVTVAEIPRPMVGGRVKYVKEEGRTGAPAGRKPTGRKRQNRI